MAGRKKEDLLGRFYRKNPYGPHSMWCSKKKFSGEGGKWLGVTCPGEKGTEQGHFWKEKRG